MNNFRKILFILFCITSVNTFAQYDDELRFASLEYYLANKIIFKEVYERNSEILKERFVKKITLRNDKNEILSELLINKNGKPVELKSYLGRNDISETIKATYDIKNNITSLSQESYSPKESRIVEFNYIGNTLLDYKLTVKNEKLDFAQMFYDNEKLRGFAANFWQGDSIPYSVSFRYDKENRLTDIRVTQDTGAIYKISYNGDEITLSSKNSYETYFVKDNIISKYKVFSEELNFSAERTFSYDENGLLDKIYIIDGRGNKYWQKYEYDYFH